MSAAPSLVSPKFLGSRIAIRRGSDASPPISPISPPLRPIKISAAYSAPATPARTAAAAVAPPSLYDVLGVPSGSTAPDIKAAYRRLARTCHPDAAVAAGAGSGNAASVEEFLRIHAAYSTLSDPEKRADYDRKLLFSNRRLRSPNFSSSSSFSSRSRRTWETDQCW